MSTPFWLLSIGGLVASNWGLTITTTHAPVFYIFLTIAAFYKG